MIVSLQSFEAIPRGMRIAQQMPSDAGYLEYVVAARFPVLGSPINGFGNNGGDAFGNAVGGYHVEGLGEAWLQQ